MKFDAKQLKQAVETIRLPEDMGERLRNNCLAADSRANAAREAEKRSLALRKAVLAGFVACAVLTVGYGLWRAGGERLWNAFWYTGINAVSKPLEEPPQVMSGEDSLPEGSGGGDLTPEPPASFVVSGLGELSVLREMAVSADDAALQEYLLHLPGGAAYDRESLTACLQAIDALPYLSLSEGEIVSIDYTPEMRFAYITTEAANGDLVQLYYAFLSGDAVSGIREGFADFLLPEPLVCCGGRVTVYTEHRGRAYGGETHMSYISWDTVTDGMYVRVTCYTDEPDRIVTEDVFAHLTICGLGDQS